MSEEINDKDKLIGEEETKTKDPFQMSKGDMLKEGQKAMQDPKKAVEGGKSKLADLLDDGKINNSNKEGKSLGEVAKDKITGFDDAYEKDEDGKTKLDEQGNPIKKKERSTIGQGLDKLADWLDDGKINNSMKGKDSGAYVGQFVQDAIDGKTTQEDGTVVEDGGPVKRWATKNKVSKAVATEILVACCLTGGFGWFYAAYKAPKQAMSFAILGLCCLLFIGIGWFVAIGFAYMLFKASSIKGKVGPKDKKKKKDKGLAGLF